jgi:hypothetical protein
MNIGEDVQTDKAARSLTRADVELLIQRVGGSNKLDVHGQDLYQVDLHAIICLDRLQRIAVRTAHILLGGL